MARIKMEDKLARTESFNAIDQASKMMNETNDCSVKAAALAFGVQYRTAHDHFAANGRQPRRGTFRTAITLAKLANAIGMKMTRVNPQDFIDQYPKAHRILRNVTTHHPKRFNKVWADGHTYIVFSRGHVGVVKNGVNHDWTVGRAMRVIDIWRVESI